MRQNLREVEIVEDDAPDAVPPAPAPGRPPVRRRTLVLGVGVLVVAVAAALTGQAVTDRAERARLERVAALPGAVAPVPGPARVLWEADGQDMVATVRTPGGLLVGIRPDAQGPVTAVAVDAADGTEVWRTTLVDEATRVRPGPDEAEASPQGGTCAAVPQDEHHVVCLATDALWWWTEDGPRQVPGATARLVVLDTRDGSVTVELSDALPPAATTFAVVGDVVAVAGGDSAEVDVRGIALDGTPLWTAAVPGRDVRGPRATVLRLDDLVAVVTSSGVRLLAVDGTTVRTVALDEDQWASQTAGSDVIVVSSPNSLSLNPARWTTVIHADADLQVRGLYVPVGVDDGSSPAAVLTFDGARLRAWDDAGDEVWSTPSTWVDEAIIVDGRVHLWPDGPTRTLDARTGEELWRSHVVRGRLLSDGHHLLGVAALSEEVGGTQLVAMDPADGTELWRVPLPDQSELAGHLKLLMAFRWDYDASGSGDGYDQRVTVLG